MIFSLKSFCISFWNSVPFFSVACFVLLMNVLLCLIPMTLTVSMVGCFVKWWLKFHLFATYLTLFVCLFRNISYKCCIIGSKVTVKDVHIHIHVPVNNLTTLKESENKRASIESENWEKDRNTENIWRVLLFSICNR